MMTQQAARYLFKTLRAIKKDRTKVDDNVTKDYLCRCVIGADMTGEG